RTGILTKYSRFLRLFNFMGVKMYTFLRILVTAVLAAFLFFLWGLLPASVTAAALSAAAGGYPLVNIAAAAAFVLLLWILAAPPLCGLLRNVRFALFTRNKIRKQIRSRQRSLVNWLLSRPAHWGITGSASEPQYANTCEGLLALRGTGFYEKKRESYRGALQVLTEAVLPTGLPSRTVNRPTVINTAMLLCLIAEEKKNPSGVIDSYDLYDEIASSLWFLHAEDGWGPLILRAEKKECRLVNTWWALRALYQYGFLERPEEGDAFRQLLTGIYEKNRGGTFGYSASDAPRLTVTAMYLLLYYDLPRRIREEIDKDYDPRAAAAFIYRRFVTEKCQVEVESIDGTYAGGTFIAHTPWKHIASAYAMQALAAARRNRDLSGSKMADVYRRTSNILTQDLRSPAVGENCYLPSDIELPRTGPYTFAAAHLILGLQTLL
ncbi:MAG: hypothetical protein Q4D81_05725, partial [Eubacteriales bacterium]|nr:hypothetical protein [Eubacteriales bacterium]